MAKKKRLTPNQQEWNRQYNRIKNYINKLNKQGYGYYTKDFVFPEKPKRIRKSHIEKLKEITPLQIKLSLGLDRGVTAYGKKANTIRRYVERQLNDFDRRHNIEYDTSTVEDDANAYDEEQDIFDKAYEERKLREQEIYDNMTLDYEDEYYDDYVEYEERSLTVDEYGNIINIYTGEVYNDNQDLVERFNLNANDDALIANLIQLCESAKYPTRGRTVKELIYESLGDDYEDTIRLIKDERSYLESQLEVYLYYSGQDAIDAGKTVADILGYDESRLTDIVYYRL